MKKFRWIFFAAMALTVLPWVTALQAKVTLTDTSVYRFPLISDGDLSVSNINGNILIEGWGKDSAQVLRQY